MQERELVKIASDNPAHPHGYYTQFRDAMQPGDMVFGETNPVIPETKPAKEETIPIEHEPAPKPAKKRKVKK